MHCRISTAIIFFLLRFLLGVLSSNKMLQIKLDRFSIFIFEKVAQFSVIHKNLFTLPKIFMKLFHYSSRCSKSKNHVYSKKLTVFYYILSFDYETQIDFWQNCVNNVCDANNFFYFTEISNTQYSKNINFWLLHESYPTNYIYQTIWLADN